MKCKICSSEVKVFTHAILLHKHRICYFICEFCGFIQTEEPHWLQEAYTDHIQRSDVGLVSRNIRLSKITKAIVYFLFDRNAKYIDYGGGYGLFVRMMRDYGFNFYHYDKYCSNILSQGFNADTSLQIRYELLTAFEVFEHLVNPHKEIEKMLGLSQNILFTTELIPPSNPKPEDWWYYGLEHGQHISFYARRTLEFIARKHNLHFYSANALHLLSKKKINKHLFALLAKSKFANIIGPFIVQKSLVKGDFDKLRQ